MDIRIPIGLLFAILGALLAAYGLFTMFNDPAMYERSLGININLWWGLVMLLFGALMLALGRGGLAKKLSESH
jgi:multisubunit Na+/H+ antiporter MnhG subunit